MRNHTPLPEHSPAPVPAHAPSNLTVPSETPYLDANGYDPAAYQGVPVLRKPRSDGWSEAKQRNFIETTADGGSVSEAARAVGMSPGTAYRLRRSPGGKPLPAHGMRRSRRRWRCWSTSRSTGRSTAPSNPCSTPMGGGSDRAIVPATGC